VKRGEQGVNDLPDQVAPCSTSATAEHSEVKSVHRSPLTYEIVHPYDGDKRKAPDNIAKRVAGHRANSNCGSEQLMENNDLAEHPVTDAAATDPDRLFESESNPPNFAILREQPEHRIIVYLKAQGLSNKEIATKTGYTQSWVCQICRQPWFRLRLVAELREAGVDAVQAVLKATVLDSVFTLIDIRDDPSTPAAVKSATCDRLLDRYFGKPTQRVESDQKTLPSSPEIQAISSELAEIDQQLKETNNAETNVTTN
jgi:hypothetical protein